MTDARPLVQSAPPEISEADAARLARDVFRVDGTAHSLGSNQDRNFVIRAAGSPPQLLKITNPATGASELEAQSLAARLIAARGDVRVPLARTLADGSTARAVEIGGVTCHARMLGFLDGDTLSGARHLSPAAIAAIGRLAASVDVALAGFEHEGTDRQSQWDLRQAARVLEELLPFVPDEQLRARLAATAGIAADAVGRLAQILPVQVVHGDLTDDNVVADSRTGIADGVIDLGDLCRSWRVAEIAITVSSLLHHDGVGPADALRAVAAYHAVRPLEEAELDALWPLVVLRGVVLVASAWRVLHDEPGNAYAAENLAGEQEILDAASALPLAVATALVRHCVGAPSVRLEVPAHAPLLADVRPGDIAVLDLSATSHSLDEGRWLDDDIEERLATDALASGARVAATRFGEPRLTRSRPGQDEPANVVLGMELTTDVPVGLFAPWPGTVCAWEDGFCLEAPGLRLSVTLVPRGDRGQLLSAGRDEERDTGELLGSFTGTIALTLDDGTDLPAAVPASLAAAWRTVAADPSAVVLGTVEPVDRPDPSALLARRDAHVAGVQEHYFDTPPLIVRGWREHLIDADARVYVDALNNVSAIGHAHPRLVEAVTAQWRLLNTNSRFHYPLIAEFAERLSGLLPDGLDSVFLVNSGSEAVDLALRLARAHTGRRDVLTIREAYHGWTDLSDAVSTSIADNPGALGSRPDWVHPLDSPDPFRGAHRDDPGRYAVDAVAEVERWAARGRPVGAFLAEPVFGNAGGMALPDGYLRAVADAVRAHGGVFIADEVQVGYGRLGEWFWGFLQQGVVPDVVTIAKAMGNGHPLGAVITTREIAESFAREGSFFSSAGGSPVSCAVGLAVLDVIEDEGLQHNARDVGGYLAGLLREIGARHPLLRRVHGFGLYLGPEFVRADGSPATEETAAICERMRGLGIMIQPTGDHRNVLKIKPPMCLTRASADAFAAALDRTLTTGW